MPGCLFYGAVSSASKGTDLRELCMLLALVPRPAFAFVRLSVRLIFFEHTSLGPLCIFADDWPMVLMHSLGILRRRLAKSLRPH